MENEDFLEIAIKETDEKQFVSLVEIIEAYKKLSFEINTALNAGMQIEATNSEKGIFQDITKKYDALESLWNKFIEFYINPPSQDEKIAINYALAMRKIAKDLKEATDFYDKIGIEAKTEKFSSQFLNFIDHNQAKLEETSKSFDQYLQNFVRKQAQQIQKFEEQIQKFDTTMFSVVSFSKKAIYSLIVLLICLSIVLGGLIGVLYLKINDLNDSTNITQKESTMKKK